VEGVSLSAARHWSIEVEKFVYVEALLLGLRAMGFDGLFPEWPICVNLPCLVDLNQPLLSLLLVLFWNDKMWMKKILQQK
jgi:hypothetical protein